MADPITLGLMAAQTVLSASSSMSKGDADNKAAKFEADQLERAAKDKYALGTRESAETIRQGKIMESNAQAQMAAGGGSASDAGAVEQLANIRNETEYNALASLYERENQAQTLRTKAGARRYEGQMAKRKGKAKALSTVLSGGSKVFNSWNTEPT